MDYKGVWKVRKFNLVFCVLITLFFLWGCTNNEKRNSLEIETFIQSLKDRGYTVIKPEIEGDTPHTFFSVYPTYYEADGKRLAIYEYNNVKKAKKDSEMISEDGYTIGNTIIEWVDKPHFYRKEKIIVSYIGSDVELQKDLNEILGKSITN
jgi:hypothetical protein